LKNVSFSAGWKISSSWYCTVYCGARAVVVDEVGGGRGVAGFASASGSMVAIEMSLAPGTGRSE